MKNIRKSAAALVVALGLCVPAGAAQAATSTPVQDIVVGQTVVFNGAPRVVSKIRVNSTGTWYNLTSYVPSYSTTLVPRNTTFTVED